MIAGQKTAYADYTVREGTYKNTTVSGLPAVTYIADYTNGGNGPETAYYTFVYSKNLVFTFTFKTSRDSFEKAYPTFETIVKSFSPGPAKPAASAPAAPAEQTSPKKIAG
jgi:hypothetical protein